MAKSPTRDAAPVRGPFYRPLRTNDVPTRGLDRRIEASAEECVAIAEATGLTGVASLAADFRVVPHAEGRYELSGSVTAAITQVCVVTLEAFDSTVTQPIAIDFAEQMPSRGADDKAATAVVAMEEQDDPPDPILNNTIDLGAVALEFLTLALDLYPKKPGVHFTDVVVGDMDQPEPSSFAALERLKDRS